MIAAAPTTTTDTTPLPAVKKQDLKEAIVGLIKEFNEGPTADDLKEALRITEETLVKVTPEQARNERMLSKFIDALTSPNLEGDINSIRYDLLLPSLFTTYLACLDTDGATKPWYNTDDLGTSLYPAIIARRQEEIKTALAYRELSANLPTVVNSTLLINWAIAIQEVEVLDLARSCLTTGEYNIESVLSTVGAVDKSIRGGKRLWDGARKVGSFFAGSAYVSRGHLAKEEVARILAGMEPIIDEGESGRTRTHIKYVPEVTVALAQAVHNPLGVAEQLVDKTLNVHFAMDVLAKGLNSPFRKGASLDQRRQLLEGFSRQSSALLVPLTDNLPNLVNRYTDRIALYEKIENFGRGDSEWRKELRTRAGIPDTTKLIVEFKPEDVLTDVTTPFVNLDTFKLLTPALLSSNSPVGAGARVMIASLASLISASHDQITLDRVAKLDDAVRKLQELVTPKKA